MKQIGAKGTTVLFQGDSITDCGRDRTDPNGLGDGYPLRIAELYGLLFPNHGVRFLNRGVSGDRTGDLIKRYKADFRSLKPDLVSILIGINDTWRRYDAKDPTSAEQFEANYQNLLKKLKKDLPDARIVILEPFLLDPPDKRAWREDLDPKIHITRALAEKYADIFIPLDGIFAQYAAAGIKRTAISGDGVHPAPQGHALIAAEWLKALGAL
jgi:lysophospholipase L1-like esterase